MKTLIFADVHLQTTPQGEATLNDFTAFLRQIDPAEIGRVVVLGDLFDFWFEYKHVIFSDYFEVLRAFRDLSEQGVELHLICGNHDFWAGRFLEKFLAFQIHPDSYACDMGGKRVLFVHGDGVNPDDVKYRIYKRIARSHAAVWAFSLLHPDWAMALARRISHGSRTLLKPDDPAEGREVAPIEKFAVGILQANEADVVVCGHTHYPVMKPVERTGDDGLYINTGDWLSHRTYLDWDGETFTRRFFEGLARISHRFS
jgi:UDP-2,3-diacylglucosamine hydrolase